MTGSLQIKKDKFYMVLNLTQNGKRRQKWISTGYTVKGNKKKAEQMLRETLREYEIKEQFKCSDMFFPDAVRLWLKECAGRVDEITLQGYYNLSNAHILPYFEELGLKLSEIDRSVLQTYVDQKHQNGRKDGKGGLSPRSLRLHKNILYQTLNMAVRDGLIPNNPCNFLILPQAEHYESHFYSGAQLAELLDAVRDENLFPVIKFTAVYGLRRSEVLGLKWDSVDFDAGTITVKHTVAKVTQIVEKDKTKNKTSRRTFPLTPDVREMLLDLKRQEDENRRLFCSQYTENNYILKWDDGRPFAPDYVSHRFSRLLEIYEMPHIRFHELRHSCASFLLNTGFTLKDVQEWLGHSDIKMTANIYGHLDVGRKMGMAEKITATLSKLA